jgi:AMP-polyphosphate phosphotransferase
MLDTLDLGASLGRTAYEKAFWPLRDRLALLQREVYESGLPVIVLFEGFAAAGKGDTIEKLVGRIDPRGYAVHVTGAPGEEDRAYPFLRRFWTKLPAKGEMAIFDGSWYRRVLAERVEGEVPRRRWKTAYDEINQHERTLCDDGVLMVKLFLHVSRAEQRRRLEKMERNRYQAWQVTKRDWRANRRYPAYLEAAEEMLERTHTAWAPWTPVAATDRRWRRVKVFEAVAAALRRALDERRRRPPAASRRPRPARAPGGPTVLDDVDLARRLSPARYQAELEALQGRLRELQLLCWKRQVPVVVAYEGWDAAGKGGNIRRLIGALDPRGYTVVPIAAPQGDEATHHYLWRFWKRVPRAGHLAIFDRTWYGRVLVERVEGFCSEAEWRRAYQEINEFERSLHQGGAVLAKFWLHISKQMQLRRFRERERVAQKRYKITPEDWRNREKWGLYRAAVHDMITQTSTTHAPWTIVEAEDKGWARIRTMRTLVGAIEGRLG